MRKNSKPFTGSLTRNLSIGENFLNAITADLNSNNKCSSSLSMVVRAILLDKKPEKVPILMESVLSKVVEEFEHHIASQTELVEEKRAEVNSSHYKSWYVAHANEVSRGHPQCWWRAEVNSSHYKSWYVVHANEVSRGHPQCWWSLHIHGLACVASGYHKVLEENHKLYNQVQDLKGSIRVYCRVRPFLGGQSKYLSSVEHIEKGTITITTPSKYRKGHRSFNFNKVFRPSATQAEVFSDTQPLIRFVLDGYNVCIFAYGQIGSGKTYTMETNHVVGATALNDRSRSEWVNKSEVTGDRLKEAQHINKSLSALGDVIFSLAQKNSHVPYRSRGQAKTLMFVHISPELNVIGETISTLKFAERVAIVELGAACVNKNSADVEELKEQPM
ncbi:unnamed protein product [Camellia sinensis]